MSEDDSRSPEDEFREMLQQFLNGNGNVDPNALAKAAGLPSDPQALQGLMAQLQNAMNNSADGIDWNTAVHQAKAIAAANALAVTTEQKSAFEQAFTLADLWLSPATAMGELSTTPRLLTRSEWIELSMPVWSRIAEPVALSIADTLTNVLREQAPEELSGMLAGAGQMMRSLGGALFALQLGQAVGRLSGEVISGGDIGVPVIPTGQGALLPQNVADFGEGLGIDESQVRLFLAVRELAHARLFRHAKWLELHLVSSMTEYARGIHIDVERMTELAERLDPQNPEELKAALAGGQLIPPKTEKQLAALTKIETMLALIEGWVTTVTTRATGLLPSAAAIAETVQRRRAAGGPAESAFATLIGLELRPRRLRKAAAMWSAVTDAVGLDERDRLWSHPDLMPSAEEIDNPQLLVQRIQAPAPEPDEMDQELEKMLNAAESGESAAGESTESDDTDGNTSIGPAAE